jgi:hypothetical protein
LAKPVKVSDARHNLPVRAQRELQAQREKPLTFDAAIRLLVDWHDELKRRRPEDEGAPRHAGTVGS